jgi:signal transduction histidine kinase
MKAKNLFFKTIPALFVTIPLINALIIFIFKYNGRGIPIPLIVNTDEENNRLIFCLNFYIPFIIYAIALYGCIFSSGFYIRGICLTVGFISAVLSVYILDDLFTLKIYVYTAYIIVVALTFSSPKSIIIEIAAIFLFLLFVQHPPFMGIAPMESRFINPDPVETIPAIEFMLFISAGMIIIRTLFNRYLYNMETIKHLNFVGTKMTLFNHRLQELALQRGEEAVKQDRLRFTRDLHDSCGYAFTNIIMVSDAVVSQGQTDGVTQEILQKIRKLALNGLDDTRETLHLIRKIQEPYANSVETVYQLKTIFEEVTGIDVKIEWGNMRHEYGPMVNKVIARIIQESFTNAVRHGKATAIVIQFWEFQKELSMTVTDNGTGASVVIKGIGLAGMEERLETIGGKLAVSSPSEGGFRLKITIPIVGR